MNNLSIEIKIALGIFIVIVAYIFFRGFGGAAKDVTKAAVDTGAGAIAGIAEGIGAQVGIPATSLNACELACAAGDTWQASLQCSAGRFVQYLRDGK